MTECDFLVVQMTRWFLSKFYDLFSLIIQETIDSYFTRKFQVHSIKNGVKITLTYTFTGNVL